MSIIQRISRTFILVIFSVIFLSCKQGIEFSKYETLNNSTWESNKRLSFKFIIKDTIKPKNLFINIRNNKDYSFSNLYVITQLDFPSGAKIIDTLQYRMTNEYGEFLGYGFSNIKENKLYYKESKVFPEKGEYQFSIYHAMRKQGEINPMAYLHGVQDVGFSIEK